MAEMTRPGSMPKMRPVDSTSVLTAPCAAKVLDRSSPLKPSKRPAAQSCTPSSAGNAATGTSMCDRISIHHHRNNENKGITYA
jgi:hypothetical protein